MDIHDWSTRMIFEQNKIFVSRAQLLIEVDKSIVIHSSTGLLITGLQVSGLSLIFSPIKLGKQCELICLLSKTSKDRIEI